LLDALDSIVAEIPDAQSDQKATPVTIDAAYKKVRKAAKAADSQGQDEDPDSPETEAEHDQDAALHLIRKRAKRLRYTAAATGEDEVSKQAKAIQTLLGDHHDSVVSRENLVEQAEVAHVAGEDTFTYGLLYQLETELADSCRAQLGDALHKLDKSVRTARG
jgi:CHAD domain-containing protein